jgi:isorenieratene synthase
VKDGTTMPESTHSPYSLPNINEHPDPVESSRPDALPVVVIGAGLAGMSAGAHLAEAGVSPLVLEADWGWAGGRLASGEDDIIQHEGRDWAFAPEHGVHALWGGYVNMHTLFERFTQTKLIPSSGEMWMNRWGKQVRQMEAGNAVRSKYIPAPFHHLNLLLHPQIWANIAPWDFFSLPGLVASILLTVGVDPIKEQKAWDGLNMREYFRGWTPNLKATFRGLAANLLAAHEETISLSAFIASLRFYTMLRRDSWNMHYMPADSHQALTQPMLDFINNRGGMVEQGMTAQSLTPLQDENGTYWQIRVDDQRTGGIMRTLYAEHVIIATSAPAAQRLLLGSPELKERAEQIRFPDAVRCIVVRVWLKSAPHEGTNGGMFTGDFVPDNFFWLHRLYEPFAQWHEATGGSAIEVHIYGDEAMLDLPDSNLLVLATRDLYMAFPELRGTFLHGAVRRNSKLHTIFRVPTADSLWIDTPWDNLYASGDWVGADTPSMWMERATTTGIIAANHVIEAYGREPFPVLQPPPPEFLARLLEGVVRAGRKFFGLLFAPLVALRRRH